jgi:hypothetical protein
VKRRQNRATMRRQIVLKPRESNDGFEPSGVQDLQPAHATDELRTIARLLARHAAKEWFRRKVPRVIAAKE